MTDEAAFNAALDLNPDDHACRLMLADWLDEQGDWRAVGVRWIVTHQKTPIFQFERWGWYHNGATENAPRSNELPYSIWLLVFPEAPHRWGDFPHRTRRAAEDALARVLWDHPELRRRG